MTCRALFSILPAAILVAACSDVPVLTRQVEARRLAADMHLQFTKAVEASNRAVMADTDEDAGLPRPHVFTSTPPRRRFRGLR
jgi:hypothetical protein